MLIQSTLEYTRLLRCDTVVGWVVTRILKYCCALIFRVRQPKKNRLTLKIRAQYYFKILVTTRPTSVTSQQSSVLTCIVYERKMNITQYQVVWQVTTSVVRSSSGWNSPRRTAWPWRRGHCSRSRCLAALTWRQCHVSEALHPEQHHWENLKSQHNIQFLVFYSLSSHLLLHLLPTSHATWEPLSDGIIHVTKWHPVTESALNALFWCRNGLVAIPGTYECSTFNSSNISWIG
jgi:hypothetical protein